ncbi:hypothetical protein DW322_21050 [Rhodococcus rhodnii]|uniref:Uncharacterized protein n=2 Tax=Rhodococcus rhodnii TaxID=38312 RepID=R7WK28_9NOCA|nr:hypothetical protein [Rhodococcus rhodnii]EOM74329.1 hypothetical protein Rrhod_4327 [Rhodococcus rhodnii LMG 5362]TXG92197.1 hypothetical protein DW322_21050 [Rhodococcus rhodnii]
MLRNFTVGFVTEEQAYVGLVANGEWDSLIQMPPGHERAEPDGASDAITVLGDNRDQRFRAGIEVILAGSVA